MGMLFALLFLLGAALSGGSRRRQVSLNRIRQALAAPSTLHITLAEPPTFRVEARQHPFVFEKSVPWEVAGGAPIPSPSPAGIGSQALAQVDLPLLVRASHRALCNRAAQRGVDR
jgi:hypothetical protein